MLNSDCGLQFVLIVSIYTNEKKTGQGIIPFDGSTFCGIGSKSRLDQYLKFVFFAILLQLD